MMTDQPEHITGPKSLRDHASSAPSRPTAPAAGASHAGPHAPASSDPGAADLFAKIPRPTHRQDLSDEQYSPFMGTTEDSNSNETTAPLQPPPPSTTPEARAIYQDVIAACQPFEFDGHLQGYADPGAYRGIDDPARTLSRLREKYPDQELEAAGVMREGALWAELVGKDTIVIALREKAGAAPFDLMSEMGCASGEIPAIAVLNDVVGSTLSGDQQELREVHLAFSMLDVAALRAFGLPSAPAMVHTQLQRHSLKLFLKYFGDGYHAVPFTVHAWHLYDRAGSAPPQLGQFRAFYEKLEHHLELRLEEAFVFRPSEALIQSLAFAIDVGGADQVREIFDKARRIDAVWERLVKLPGPRAEPLPPALEGSSNTVAVRVAAGAKSTPQATVPHGKTDNSVAKAAKALGIITSKISNRSERLAKRQERDRVIEEKLLEPLRVQALRAPNAFAANVGIMLAQCVGVYHRQVTNLMERAAMQTDTSSGIPEPPAILPAQDVQALATLNSSICKLLSETIKNWNSTPLISASAPKRTHLATNSPRSDSAKPNSPR